MLYKTKISFILIFQLTFALSSSFSQKLTKLQYNTLSQKEDSLKIDAYKIINSLNAEQRFRADSQFTRIFVRALKIPFSFNYPFDSLFQISKLYAPDSNFRIFTWQVSRDEEMHRRHGAIQMKTKDGSLKLFPLIDRSFLISNQKDTITNNEWWIGAIYYKIIKKEFKGKSFYTLLGYDENTLSSTKKRIEVLKFDENVLPVFGGDYFAFQKDTIPKASQSRFWIEFKKNGNGRIFYDNELDMIIYDHLISETNEPTKLYTFIPDGDYEGFKWINGQWQHIEKVFTSKLLDGQAPIEKPVTANKLKKETNQQ